MKHIEDKCIECWSMDTSLYNKCVPSRFIFIKSYMNSGYWNIIDRYVLKKEAAWMI